MFTRPFVLDVFVFAAQQPIQLFTYRGNEEQISGVRLGQRNQMFYFLFFCRGRKTPFIGEPKPAASSLESAEPPRSRCIAVLFKQKWSLTRLHKSCNPEYKCIQSGETINVTDCRVLSPGGVGCIKLLSQWLGAVRPHHGEQRCVPRGVWHGFVFP